MQENKEKFQSMVMQCIRHVEKQPVLEDDKDSPETSTVLPKSPTPLPHTHLEGFPFHGPHQPFHHPYTSDMTNKVKLPIFSCTDLKGWLIGAETYFQIHETPQPYKIPLAHICMEGVAVHWFTIVQELNNNLSWEVFKTELLNRFGGITNLNRYEQLVVLYQSDNADDYIDHFETIAAMVPWESEALYLGYFTNGL